MYWFGGVMWSISQGGENMPEITTAHQQYVQMVCMWVEVHISVSTKILNVNIKQKVEVYS